MTRKVLDMDLFKDLVSITAFAWLQRILFLKNAAATRNGIAFGLLNNPERDIQVYFDKDIVSEDIMTFHPNTQ